MPSQSIMTELLGESLYAVWQALCSAIDEKYDMEQLARKLKITENEKYTL